MTLGGVWRKVRAAFTPAPGNRAGKHAGDAFPLANGGWADGVPQEPFAAARMPGMGAPGFADASASFAHLPVSAARGTALARSGNALPPGALAGLSDIELLERLLACVLPEGAGRAARAAIDRFGSHAAVLAATEAELRAVPGLGTHCVAAIKLAHAACLRLSRAAIAGRPLLDGDARLGAYLTAALSREPIEHFRILFLDDAMRLRADEAQARGTVNHTPVYPREVVRRAMELGAASMILVHNHPTGDPTPSAADVAMTAEVGRAASVLGLRVHDHLIVGKGRRFSFREAGLLGRSE